MENTFGFGEFKAASEMPQMTAGICEHCKYFSIKEWDETDGPVCTFFKKCLEIDVPNSKHIIKSCIAFSSTDYKYCTKGDLDIRTIEIGDTQYDYSDKGICYKSVVIKKPVIIKNTSIFEWETKNENGRIFKYSHDIENPQFAYNIYNYDAYPGTTKI